MPKLQYHCSKPTPQSQFDRSPASAVFLVHDMFRTSSNQTAWIRRKSVTMGWFHILGAKASARMTQREREGGGGTGRGHDEKSGTAPPPLFPLPQSFDTTTADLSLQTLVNLEMASKPDYGLEDMDLFQNSKQMHSSTSQRRVSDAASTLFASVRDSAQRTKLASTLSWWSVLSTTCKAHAVEEEQFYNCVNSLEQGRPFPSFRIGAEHVAEENGCNRYLKLDLEHESRLTLKYGTEFLQSSPLICLRRFFNTRHAIHRVEYFDLIQGASIPGISNPIKPGTYHYDKRRDHLEKSDCYPDPMLRPEKWPIQSLPCPVGFSPPDDAFVIWECVIAPFQSTLSFIDGATDDYVARLQNPVDYSGVMDRFSSRVDSVTAPASSLFTISIDRQIGEFNVPVPRSIVDLADRAHDVTRGAWPKGHVDLRSIAASGMSILAALLFRLYHLHRLLHVGIKTEDDCLTHNAQLVIDSHVPLFTYVCEFRRFVDKALCCKPDVSSKGWSRRARHPKSPNALNEYAGVHSKENVKELVNPESIPQVMYLWPAANRWLVTAEEAPALSDALHQVGLLTRTSDGYTATQNWNDSGTAFVIMFVSKMWQVRNKTRADRSKALRATFAHPEFASMLIYFLHLSQLGNVPGSLYHVAFTTRIRLWSTYRTHGGHARTADWIVRQCFQTFRHSMRIYMYQLFNFYTHLNPELKNVLFSHPSKGVSFREWFVAARYQARECARRLETVPITTEDKDYVKRYYNKINNLLAKRPYDAVNKFMNPFVHVGLFPNYLGGTTTRILEQLASRVGITLKAYKDGPSNPFSAAYVGYQNSSSLEHGLDAAVAGGSDRTGGLFGSAGLGGGGAAGSSGGGSGDDLAAAADPYAEVIAAENAAGDDGDEQEDDDDAGGENDDDEAEDRFGDGGLGIRAVAESAQLSDIASAAHAAFFESDDFDDEDDEDDEAEAEMNELADPEAMLIDDDLEQLAQLIDQAGADPGANVLSAIDAVAESATERNMARQAAVAGRSSTAASNAAAGSSSAVRVEAKVGTLSRVQMNSVIRNFLVSMIYVPVLDDKGQEDMALCFKQYCFLVARYGGGARRELPLLLLGWFGLSLEGIKFLNQTKIFHEMCLPYNRMDTLMGLFRHDRPTDFALLWRYTQYVRMFEMTRPMLLPRHVALQQLKARETFVFRSETDRRDYYDALRAKKHAGQLSEFEEFNAQKMRENVECVRFCETCRGWTHPLAPVGSIQFVLPKHDTSKYIMRVIPPSQTGTIVNVASKGGKSSSYQQQQLQAQLNSAQKRQLMLQIHSFESYMANRAGQDASSVSAAEEQSESAAENSSAVASLVSKASSLTKTLKKRRQEIRKLQKIQIQLEDSRKNSFDFFGTTHRCACDVRQRVTAHLQVLISQTLYLSRSDSLETRPRLSHRVLFTPFHLVSPENRKRWRTLVDLVQFFPIRSKQVEALNRVLAIYYPELEKRDPKKAKKKGKDASGAEHRTGLSPSTSIVAAIPDTEMRRKIVEEAMSKFDAIKKLKGKKPSAGDGQNQSRPPAPLSDQTDLQERVAKDLMDPAVRLVLAGYFTGDPRVEYGKTAGMVHSEVVTEAKKAITDASRSLQTQDYFLSCNSETKAVNMIGKMISLPTQYPCLWRNYVVCSLCGMPMSAYEWRYSAAHGYVCDRHRGVIHQIDKFAGTGCYDARPASLNPYGASGGALSPLTIQQTYFVTQDSQLNGIPRPWLNAYSFNTLYDALHVESSDWHDPYFENDFEDEDVLENPGDDTARPCDQCIRERRSAFEGEPDGSLLASAKFRYIHTVEVLGLSKKYGSLSWERLCQKHFYERKRAQKSREDAVLALQQQQQQNTS